MTVILDNPDFSFLGRGFSFWTPYDSATGMRIVSGEQLITHKIIFIFLTPKGKVAYHPTLGMAPDLFDPLSNYVPQYFIYQAEQELVRCLGSEVTAIKVNLEKYRDYENQIQVECLFVPADQASPSTLTFGYYDYQGAIWNGELEPFLKGVTLNGEPFLGLTS